MTRWWRMPRQIQYHLRRPGEFVRAFARARSGAIAIIIAIMLLPMIVAAGGALDVARLYLAEARLIYALDAAAIAVGSSGSCVNAETVFDTYFTANYPATEAGTVTPSPIVPTVTGDNITAQATTTVDTFFLRLIGIDTLSATHTSQVVRRETAIELALVLDNTASMLGTKMDGLKTAALGLLDTLFQCETTPANINVAIVPYVSAVNIGTGNAGFTTDPDILTSPDNEYPIDDGEDVTDPIVDTAWKGCVEARDVSGDHDIEDTDVATGGPWTPYFSEAQHYYITDNDIGTDVSDQCANRWWRRSDGIAMYPPPTGRGSPPSLHSVLDGGGNNVATFRDASDNAFTNTSPSTSIGPNRACPTPITPLTNARATLDAAINAMEPWEGSGTIINTGMVWGWRVLSQTAPFTEGVAYGTADTTKAMVVITDGQNRINGEDSNCSAISFGRYNSEYSPYGYVSENRLGTTDVATANSILDDRLDDLCDNIKDPPAGITIFTITLGMNDDAIWDPIQTRMEACSSGAENEYYFNAPDAASLQEAFQAIGAQLRSLRIAQ